MTIYRVSRFAASFAAVACLLTSGAAMARAPHTKTPPDSTDTAVSPVPSKKVCPNKWTSEQAETALAAERDPVWLAACARGPLPLGVTKLRANVLHRGGAVATARKEIALTFDDGPHPAFTPQLLSLLRDLDVPATFFLVGEMAQRCPDIVRAELADGHEIANHTYHHVSLTKIRPQNAIAEIRAGGMALEQITGAPVHLFRPPGGKYDLEVAQNATALGYTTILWTDDPGDFKNPGVDVIVKRTLQSARPGGILLLHDGIDQMLQALPEIVNVLRSRGFTFVTVDQMLRDSQTPAPVSSPARIPDLAARPKPTVPAVKVATKTKIKLG